MQHPLHCIRLNVGEMQYENAALVDIPITIENSKIVQQIVVYKLSSTALFRGPLQNFLRLKILVCQSFPILNWTIFGEDTS